MRNQDFTKKLFAWHSAIHRPMPWKGEKNPYLIWLSEIILQQTRVEQGRAYYLKFKARFPDVNSLANASENEVLKLWQGLGYNTRARNLHTAAKTIQRELNGKFPTDYEGIRSLKGVGDYTAAAIASFAYNLPYAVVDANVFRILSRYFGIKTAIDSTEGKKQFKALAEQLLSKKEPAKFNQAIMDFGAVQCVPKKPCCPDCPLHKTCVAYQRNTVARLPVKAKQKNQRERYFHYFVIRKENFIYLRKRSGKDIWKNMFEFPMVEAGSKLKEKQLPEQAGFKLLFSGAVIEKIQQTADLKQTLTHQKIHAAFFELTIKEQWSTKKLVKAPLADITEYALPGIIRDFLKIKSLTKISAQNKKAGTA